MMSGSSQRPPRTSSARPDYNKPNPAPPSQQRYDARPDDRYTRYDGRTGTPQYSNSRPDERYGVGSPPPANYGHGPPPQGYHGRPPIAAQSRPPPTPAPPRDGNDREALWRLFGAVDKNSRLYTALRWGPGGLMERLP